MKFRLLTMACCLMICLSCEKTLDLNGGTPDFDIAEITGTMKQGTPVTFKFKGDAGIISFYSGEPLKDYAFKDGRTENSSGGTFVFTSAVNAGTQANQLTVLASNDFSGKYDMAAVKAATWTDITSRYKLGTNATFLSSGAKDLTDLMLKGKPLYIAYRYVTKPQITGGEGRTWMIQGYTYQSITPIGNLTVLEMINSGLRLITDNPATAPARSTVTGARVTFQANTFAADNDPASENWAVSGPINWEQATTGPDRPAGIKGYASTTLDNYVYTYAKAGTYKVYFVASNINIDKEETVVRTATVTITP